MSEILAQLITPEVRFALVLVLVLLALLYLLSIIWVVRDSYLRGTSPIIWGIIAIIPFLGCMVYAMMRPPLYACDREEQNIGLLLQQRELMDYGECPQCGYPTVRDYVLCPNCHVRLRNQCVVCKHTLEPEWTVCPYCATKVAPRSSGSSTGGAPNASGASRSRSTVTARKPSVSRPAAEGATTSTAGSAPAGAMRQPAGRAAATPTQGPAANAAASSQRPSNVSTSSRPMK